MLLILGIIFGGGLGLFLALIGIDFRRWIFWPILIGANLAFSFLLAALGVK